MIRIQMIAMWLCFAALGQADLAGAPMTLSFTATVDLIYNHESIDVGIDVGIGDEISGAFTFDPVDGKPADANRALLRANYRQPYAMEVTIDGATLKTPAGATEIEIGSRDNNYYIYDCAGDCGPMGPFDELDVFSQLEVERSTVSLDIVPTSYALLNLSAFGAYGIRPDGTLGYETAILEGADIPRSVTQWNAMQHRRQLVIRLKNPAGNIVSIYSTVGGFAVVVPEPPSWLYATSTSLFAGFAVRGWCAAPATC